MAAELFPDRNRPLILAHRGYSARNPENTMIAFRDAVNAGAHGIELDVQLADTGEIMVFHDYELARTTGAAGKLADTSYTALHELDAGGGEHIPLLTDILNEFGKSILYDIEIKHESIRPTGIEEALVSLIEARGLERNVVISSFNPFALREIGRLSNLPTAVNYGTMERLHWFLRRGQGRWISRSPILKPKIELATERRIKRLIRKGYHVLPWTIDAREDTERLLGYGVDGIITNDPIRAAEPWLVRSPAAGTASRE